MTGTQDHYRLQRSCGKVMFLHLSVIPFTEGEGRDLPRADTPGQNPPPPLRSACWNTVNTRAVRILLESCLNFELICRNHYNTNSCKDMRQYSQNVAKVLCRETTCMQLFVTLLPPTNEVWGKVMFSQASVILSTGEGLHSGGGSASGGSALGGGGLHQEGCLHPGVSASRGLGKALLPIRYYGKRSTSGRYPSYWNAFLVLEQYQNDHYLTVPIFSSLLILFFKF